MDSDLNVLGEPLEECGTDPVTGFYRDDCCTSGPEDLGSHTVCAVMTTKFLTHQTSVGNDLVTPRPEYSFTGLRPGEKLFEELLIGKNVTGTEHPRILRAMEQSLTWDQMRHVLDDLAQCSIRFDCERAREVLLRAVPEYSTTDKVQDHVWIQGGMRVSGAVLADEEKVRELRPRSPA